MLERRSWKRRKLDKTMTTNEARGCGALAIKNDEGEEGDLEDVTVLMTKLTTTSMTTTTSRTTT
eukprot:9490304-Pyramimonas_sp.AAC.2